MIHLQALLTSLLLSATLGAQQPRADDRQDREVLLPDGRSQRNAILKADHSSNLEDAAKLLRLAEALQADLDKQGQFVVSLECIKRTEEIEKLARRMRARMKRP
jgi:hypothetical protein